MKNNCSGSPSNVEIVVPLQIVIGGGEIGAEILNNCKFLGPDWRLILDPGDMGHHGPNTGGEPSNIHCSLR